MCGGRERVMSTPISEPMTAAATSLTPGIVVASAGARWMRSSRRWWVGDAAAQGFDELRAGGPDPGMDLVGEAFGIGLALRQHIEDRPSTCAHDV